MNDEKEIRDKEAEEEYNEDEDEDFNPDLAQDDDDFSDDDEEVPKKKRKSGDEDAEIDVETEKEVKKANYSKIESSEGGLIKTRHQRAVEQQSSFKSFKDVSGITSDINDAWAKLQQDAQQRLKFKYSAEALTTTSGDDSAPRALQANEKIKITRKYEYAGEMVTEEKWVDRESAEAKAYLKSLSEEEKEKLAKKDEETTKTEEVSKSGFNERGEKLRVVRKRPPLLEGIINGSIKPKFNTLEKSRVDFAQLVDKEGINDELEQHSKDGYLEKQDFLSRVQFHRETQVKEMRRKELQNKQK